MKHENLIVGVIKYGTIIKGIIYIFFIGILISCDLNGLFALFKAPKNVKISDDSKVETTPFTTSIFVNEHNSKNADAESTIVIEFSNNIEQLDIDRYIVERKRSDDLPLQLPVSQGFFYQNRVFLTVSYRREVDDILQVFIQADAIMSKGIGNLQSDAPRIAIIQKREPEILVVLGEPNSKNIYVLYNSLLESSTLKLKKFSVQVTPPAQKDRDINEDSSRVLTPIIDGELNRILAIYQDTIPSGGVIGRYFSNYILKINIEGADLNPKDTITINAEKQAVQSTSGIFSNVAHIKTQVKKDEIAPTLLAININNENLKKIELTFTETLTKLLSNTLKDGIILKIGKIGEDETMLDVLPDSTAINKVEYDSADKSKIILTLNESLPKTSVGNVLQVTIPKETVEDLAANINKEKIIKTGTIKNTKAPKLQAHQSIIKTTKESDAKYVHTVQLLFDNNIKAISARKTDFQISQVTTSNKTSHTITQARIKEDNDRIVELVFVTDKDLATDYEIEVVLKEKTIRIVDDIVNEKITENIGVSPIITAITANDGADTKIVVEFSESVKDIDATKFKVQVEQGTGSASAATTMYATARAPGAAVVSGDDAKKVTLTLTAAFAQGNVIKVTLDGIGAVQDIVGYNSADLTTATPKSTAIVSDGTKPKITDVFVNSNNNTKIIILFDELVQNLVASNFSIKVSGGTNGISPQSGIVLGDGSGSSVVTKSKRITLTVTNAITKNNSTLTLAAGAIKDTAGNQNASVSQSILIPSIEYKADASYASAYFTAGDYRNNEALKISGVRVGSNPYYEVEIDSNPAYTISKIQRLDAVSTSGSFDIGLSMPTTTWDTITNNLALRITVKLYDSTGTVEQARNTFNVTAKPVTTKNGISYIDIYTWRDLQNIQKGLEKKYILQNNIKFPAPGKQGFSATGFVPIGDSSNKFTGLLDGNNKTITGLYINDTSLDYVGLFGYIGKTTTNEVAVENLTLHDTSIIAKKYVGTLAGYVNNAKIENVASTVDNSNSTSKIEGFDNVGGLIGVIENTIIQGYTTIPVQGTGSEIGGLVGHIKSGTVYGYATGNVTLHNTTANVQTNIGGLVGNIVSGNVYGYATGNITTPNNINANSSIGGLIGKIDQRSTTVYGYALGYVTGNKANVGAVIGNIVNTNTNIKVYAGRTNAENVVEKQTTGVGDHVGIIVTTPIAVAISTSNTEHVGNIVEGTTSKNKDSFIGFDFTASAWKWKIDSSKTWPILNVPATWTTGHTQNPKIPDKPTNFVEFELKDFGDGQILKENTNTRLELPFNKEIFSIDNSKITVKKDTTIISGISIGKDKNTLYVEFPSPSTFNTITITLDAEAVTANDNTQNTSVITKTFMIHIVYKPYDQAHNDKFSLGDYNNKELFGVRNLIQVVGTVPFYTVAISSGYTETTNIPTNTIPKNGNFDIGLDMSYDEWEKITDRSSVTITVKVYANGANINTGIPLTTGSFTVTKTPNGNIYSWRGLQNMQAKLDGTYTLQNDIVFPTAGEEGFPIAGFVPIGNSSTNPFSGFLNGNDKKIIGLYIKNTSLDYAGLFGHITGPVNVIAVQRLTLHNASVTAKQFVGTLVGKITRRTITAVKSTTDNTSSTDIEVTGASDIGGLVGHSYNSTIVNSSATGDVKATATLSRVGGLIGTHDNSSSITNSHATGQVTGGSEVGGLVGMVNNNSIIDNSHATGQVTGGSEVGGLVGSSNVKSIIRNNSYATGNIIATGDSVGGLVGTNDSSSIIQSYAEGAVTVTSSGNIKEVGGLVGNNSGSNNSGGKISGYATGEVKVTGSQTSDIGGLVGKSTKAQKVEGYATGDVTSSNARRIGGLVGSSMGMDVNNNNIVKGYATGNVKGSREVGGLVGLSQSSSIEGYATGDIDGHTAVGGLVGFTKDSGSVKGYAIGQVTGTSKVGGLVGTNHDNKDSSYSITVKGYAIGQVTGTSEVGGLVGFNRNGLITGYTLGYVLGNPAGSGVSNGVDNKIYAGHTSNEATAEAIAMGSGDHVGIVNAIAPTSIKKTSVAPTRWVIEGSGTNTSSKFYSKNKVSFEATGKELPFSNNSWDFTIDSSKQWPILNLPAKIGVTDYPFSAGHTQDPKIPAKPTHFHEGPLPKIKSISTSTANQKELIVEFTEVIKNPDKTKFKVTLTLSSVSSTTRTVAKIDSINTNANKVTLTVQSDFIVGTIIEVTLDADAVQNLYGNKSEQDTKGVKKGYVGTGINYKIYDIAHRDKFSLGDYNSNALFGIRGLITLKNTKPQYEVSIKNGTTEVYKKAKTPLAHNVPASGNFDIAIDMPYDDWEKITDETELTIQLIIYDSTGNTQHTTDTFTAKKNPRWQYIQLARAAKHASKTKWHLYDTK